MLYQLSSSLLYIISISYIFPFEKSNLFFFFSRRFCVGSLTEKRRRRLVPSVLRFCNHVTVCLLQVSLQDEVVSVILYYFGGGRFEDWECYFWRLQDISTPDFFNPKVQPLTFHPHIFQLWFFSTPEVMVEKLMGKEFML